MKSRRCERWRRRPSHRGTITSSVRRLPLDCLAFSQLPPAWLAGNATEPLLYIFGLIVTFCVLSGRWHIMLYVFAGVALYVVTLLYGLYLEYNAQQELERRAKEQARTRQRLGARI